MKLRNLGVLGAAGLLAVTAAVPAFAQDKGELKIGIDLPLSGGEVANGEPTQNGVLLAIQQANEAGGVGGYIGRQHPGRRLRRRPRPEQGAANMAHARR